MFLLIYIKNIGNMYMGNIKIVLFDMDGTILKGRTISKEVA